LIALCLDERIVVMCSGNYHSKLILITSGIVPSLPLKKATASSKAPVSLAVTKI
jgi:hypothetical protein